MNTADASTPAREPFAAFLADILDAERADPALIARAFALHLATAELVKLPKAAQPTWQSLVTRLLKVPGDTHPIPASASAAIASWPMARVGELIAAVRFIEAEIARAANDRLADETNERVSRSYL
jgi:hypothetical protein